MITYDVTQIFPKFILNDQNGRAMVMAIKAGMDYFLAKCQEGIDTIQDVDKMPEWRLDEMAWEYNCMYDYNADVEIKREWIRNALTYYKIHGTAEGIRQYLSTYFGESQINEWFESDLAPGYFDVVVTGARSEENEAWIYEAVANAKNVRSILNHIIFNGAESSGSILCGTASLPLHAVIESTLY